jgi:hypothetical protein
MFTGASSDIFREMSDRVQIDANAKAPENHGKSEMPWAGSRHAESG